MIFWAALLIPLFAFWLWLPLRRSHRRSFWWVYGATVLAGISPALLIAALRHTTVSFDLIAPLQPASGWLLAALVLAWLLAVLRDVLYGVLRLLGLPAAARATQAPRTTVAGVALALLVCGYGTFQGLQVPQVREHTVQLSRLPPELDGLRIAVLADIHASPVNNARYVQAVVERTNAAQPDLIVLPGDMVDGDAPTQAANIAPLAQLRAPFGVWSAPGNHEYYSGFDAWAQVYEELQLHYLTNHAQVLDIRGQRVAISGVGDPAYGRLSQQNRDPNVPEGMPPDVLTVAEQARAAGAQFHILLGHQPKMAPLYAPHGVDLQIAGHTHGGHIVGMDRWLVAPANAGFVRGLYDVGAMRLFVSSGAGLWAGFALRLGVPSAIDLLVLRAAPAGADQPALTAPPPPA